MTQKNITHWLVFFNNQLLLKKQPAEQAMPTTSAVQSLKKALLRQHLLLQTEQSTVYCAELVPDTPIPPSLETVPLRKALESLGSGWYNVVSKAYAIINWDKNHQYCGRCGKSTHQRGTTFERVCEVCALTFYPRISPSIIVLIQRDNDILMARSPHFIPNVYGLIAGFVEAGETIEEAVHREVQEEVGIKIKNLRYFGSQSWPFPDSLMIAFTAEYASGDLHIDHTEIETAGWFPYDQLPGRPSSGISIAKRLIEHFIAEKKNGIHS